MILQQVGRDMYGAICTYRDTIIRLDPRTLGSGINFVSHAHTDHLPAPRDGKVLTAKSTVHLARARGKNLTHYDEYVDGLKLYDSGHILGSRSIMVGDIFYTGDICTRTRGFLEGAKIPQCETLITECTFGLPEFSFPPIHKVRALVDEIISKMYARGVPVILMGYELGKAQTLSQMFSHWEPVYYHDSVKKMNDIHRQLGISIPDRLGHTEAMNAGLLRKRPWIMIAPMLKSKSPFLAEMRQYGAVTVSFSGWAVSGQHVRSGADYNIPLSDHCDFNELVDMVKRSGASQVYTVHGFVDYFAASLAEQGINAEPLPLRALH